MKKLFIAALVLAASVTTASAQDRGYFKHVSAGLEIGLTGIGVEVASPIGNHFAVRAGMDVLPKAKVKDIDVNISSAQTDWENYRKDIKALAVADPSLNQFDVDIPNKILIDGEIKLNHFKMLVDYYPSKKSSFRFTAGFYVGNDKVVSAYTTNAQAALAAITKYNEEYAGTTKTITVPGYSPVSYTFGDKIGAKVGDYLITPNGEQATASIKVSKFKPYLGIGFGRAVPKKRVGLAVDLGVLFWGTPKIFVDQKNGPVQIEKNNVEGDGGVIKAISQVKAYPNISFRLIGRIF